MSKLDAWYQMGFLNQNYVFMQPDISNFQYFLKRLSQLCKAFSVVSIFGYLNHVCLAELNFF